MQRGKKIDHLNIAFQLLDNGQYSAAIQEFNKCAYPNDVKIQTQIARCYMFMGKLTEALSVLNPLTDNIRYDDERERVLYSVLAQANSLLYKKTSEEIYLAQEKSALDKHPNQNNPDIQIRHAWNYLHRGELNKSSEIVVTLLNEQAVINNKKLMSDLMLLKATVIESLTNTKHGL